MSDTDAKTTETTEVKTEAPAPVEEKPVEAPIVTEEKQEKEKEVNLFDPEKLNILNDVSVLLTIEIGRAQIKIRDLLSLSKGSVIELNKLAGDPVDVYANGKLVSNGNIITANGKYCVRLTSIPENGKGGTSNDGK